MMAAVCCVTSGENGAPFPFTSCEVCEEVRRCKTWYVNFGFYHLAQMLERK